MIPTHLSKKGHFDGISCAIFYKSQSLTVLILLLNPPPRAFLECHAL